MRYRLTVIIVTTQKGLKIEIREAVAFENGIPTTSKVAHVYPSTPENKKHMKEIFALIEKALERKGQKQATRDWFVQNNEKYWGCLVTDNEDLKLKFL